jgi:hypothetical protein
VFSPAEWLKVAEPLLTYGGIVVVHLHGGDPDPGERDPVGTVEQGRWSVRGYRCST